ncbi:MAG: peptide MFS transporter [Rikenellaceae bacterium]|nr:peptide MFS transporter [Rikenellaceae bacterium]
MAKQEKVRFSKAFWVANMAEMFERAAYYGVFVVITLYLSNILGFSDIEAGIISGLYASLLYFLPPFTGAYADRIGFRKSMLLAFTLLTIGYAGLALLPTGLEAAGLVEYGERTTFTGLTTSGYRYAIVPILVVLMVGGSFIKGIISGSVAKETDEKNRARGFAIFYAMINIGSFSGKFIIEPLRQGLGDSGLIYLNWFSVAMTLLALVAIYIFYRSDNAQPDKSKTMRHTIESFGKLLRNGRLIALILIVSGFWIVYYQLYATMPKYVIRLAGEASTIGWYTMLNPLVVILTVNGLTRMLSKRSALFSMMLGMCIIPISALIMSSGHLFSEPILGLHPVVFMMLCGIVVQALAEALISPRYLEYFSLQSPKGEEGMYLGFAQLESFVSTLVGFAMSGWLLDKYCPDPARFATHEEWLAASANAHYIWYYFAAIAAVAAVALVIYQIVVKRLDEKKLKMEN